LPSLAKIIGQNLRYYRAQRELSQAALAKLAKVSTTTVNSYEAETANVSGGVVAALALALGIDEDQLFHPGFPPRPIEHTPAECLATSLKALETLPEGEVDAFASQLLRALRKK
jgi:transcriptional regulator with XRE-family HTH domain